MMFVVLVYDVAEERLPRALAVARKYLQHVMLSGFEGDLSASDLKNLEEEILRVCDPMFDSIRIYVFESRRHVRIMHMGPPVQDSTVI